MDVVRALQAAGGMASTAELVARGVTRNGISRSVARGAVLRLRPRVYGLQPLPPLPRFLVGEQGVAPAYVQHVQAVLLELGPSAVAAGRTAAVLLGWPLLVEPLRTVEVAVPHGRSRASAAGVVVRRHRDLRSWHLETSTGRSLPVTPALRTLADISAARPLVEAVVAADSALAAGHLALEDLLACAGSSARLRRVAASATGDAGSPPETVLRLGLLRAGLAPRTQYVIRSRGVHVLRTDFCFPEARLVVEVDGQRWHADLARDRSTDNALALLGWRVLRFSGREVLRDLDRVVEQVRTALGTGSTHVGQPGRGAAA